MEEIFMYEGRALPDSKYDGIYLMSNGEITDISHELEQFAGKFILITVTVLVPDLGEN